MRSFMNARTLMLAASLSGLATFGMACNDSTNSNAGPAAPAAVPAGPGASLMCASTGKNAWETYGENAFVAVNESIFTNVESIGATTSTTTPLGNSFTLVGSGNPSSTADNLATFKGNLAAFLVYVYGGPTQITYTDGVTYQGPQSMQQAHQGLAITLDQFNYFVANAVVPALTVNGVSTADVSSCFAPPLANPSFINSIVGQ